MFIQTNTTDNELKLLFLKSNNVKAFPCGRRRSSPDGNTGKYRLPFDPEARLNTEFNNRNQVSLGGFGTSFIQSYDPGEKIYEGTSAKLKKAGTFIISINGYLFTIIIDDAECIPTAADFGNKIALKLGLDANATSIYANIRIEKTTMFSRTEEADACYTWVLCTQSNSQDKAALDLLREGGSVKDSDRDNYYFSGLSFSKAPLADVENTTSTALNVATTDGSQLVCSLCILKKDDSGWHINKEACLPKITHGSTENSVVVGDLYADNLKVDNVSVPSIKLVPLQEDSNVKYQLQFSSVDICPPQETPQPSNM